MKITVCDFCNKSLVSHGSNGFITVSIQLQGHSALLAYAHNTFNHDLCIECGLPFIEFAKVQFDNYLKKLHGEKTE